jgi:microcystin-dependent protein
MAKTKISEFDATASGNTDIDGINIAEGMSPGLVNNAFRELMAQLKDFQTGASGDSLTVGGNLSVTGTCTLDGRLVDAFPSGTKMLFQQTSAPIGWTKDTTHDNKALRVITGTAGTGGSINFTTAFGSQNVGDTTLTTDQIPSHTHTFSGSGSTGNAGGHGHTINDPGHRHVITTGVGNVPQLNGDGRYSSNDFTGSAVTGISINAVGDHLHSLSISGTSDSTGGGTAHTHSLDLAVSYVDVIICTKT